MLQHRVFRQLWSLFTAVALIIVAACSDHPETVTTVFPLASPARFANVDASTLLVSDYAGHTLHLVDKQSLEPVRSFLFKGEPTGVLYFKRRYYVANKSTRSIDVLDSRGRLLYHLGKQTGLFQQINDLDIDQAKGLLYAVDTRAAVIKVFDVESPEAPPAEIGSAILEKPTALYFDPLSDRLYVSDFGDTPNGKLPRVHILDASGTLLDVLVASPAGMMGTQSFSTPQGLCVDADGLLYLVDALSGEVQIYDLPTKQLVKTLGQTGTEVGELLYPLDVFVDEKSKDVYVADNRNGRITLYPEGGRLP